MEGVRTWQIDQRCRAAMRRGVCIVTLSWNIWRVNENLRYIEPEDIPLSPRGFKGDVKICCSSELRRCGKKGEQNLRLAESTLEILLTYNNSMVLSVTT